MSDEWAEGERRGIGLFVGKSPRVQGVPYASVEILFGELRVMTATALRSADSMSAVLGCWVHTHRGGDE